MLTVVEEATPDEPTQKVIIEGLDAFNDAVALAENISPFWIIGRDEKGEPRAGLKARTLFNWMAAEILWVTEPLSPTRRRLRPACGSGACRVTARRQKICLSRYIQLSGAGLL